jgi:small multidrug resistance pump
MHNYIFLGLAIIAEVIATSALKASEGFSQLVPSIIVVVGYGAAFFLMSLTLKALPVGIIYATWSGAGIVLISLVGHFFMGQKMDLAAVVGVAFIVVGVVIVNALSKTSAH